MDQTELNKVTTVHDSKLQTAILEKNIEEVENLIKNIKEETILGTFNKNKTLFHYLTESNLKQTDVCRISKDLIKKVKPDKIKNLREVLDKKDIYDKTPLDYAGENGNLELIELFLENGATISRDLMNHIASHTDKNNALLCAQKITDYLSSKELNLQNYLNTPSKLSHKTPLHLAALNQNIELIEELILRKADLALKDTYERNILHLIIIEFDNDDDVNKIIKKLSEENKHIEGPDDIFNQYDKNGKLPIHLLTEKGYKFYKCLKMFKSSFIKKQEHSENTILHLAASLRNPGESFICTKKIIKVLAELNMEEHKDFIDSQNMNKETALHLSAKFRNLESCKCLLETSASLLMSSKCDVTPLELIYLNIPSALEIIFKRTFDESDYVKERNGDFKQRLQIDYSLILCKKSGKLNRNMLKETSMLKVLGDLEFQEREKLLRNSLIDIYLHKKWNMIKLYFYLYRAIYILWLLLNLYLFGNFYGKTCMFSQLYNLINIIPGLKKTLSTFMAFKDSSGSQNCFLIETNIFFSAYAILNIVGFFIFAAYGIIDFLQNLIATFSNYKRYKNIVNQNLIWMVIKIAKSESFFSLVFLIFIFISIDKPLVCKFYKFENDVNYFLVNVTGILIWSSLCKEIVKITFSQNPLSWIINFLLLKISPPHDATKTSIDWKIIMQINEIVKIENFLSNLKIYACIETTKKFMLMPPDIDKESGEVKWKPVKIVIKTLPLELQKQISVDKEKLEEDDNSESNKKMV